MTKYLLRHSHKHGDDYYPFQANDSYEGYFDMENEFPNENLLKFLKVDYEPERREHIEITEVDSNCPVYLPDKGTAFIDDIEISPIMALDEQNNPTTYDKATCFEVCDEGEEVAWGVYIHREEVGAECLFDVVDKKNAIAAAKVLAELYNLKLDL